MTDAAEVGTNCSCSCSSMGECSGEVDRLVQIAVDEPRLGGWQVAADQSPLANAPRQMNRQTDAIAVWPAIVGVEDNRAPRWTVSALIVLQ